MYEWRLFDKDGDNTNCPFPELSSEYYIQLWYQFNDSDINDFLIYDPIVVTPEKGNLKDLKAFRELAKIKDHIDEFVDKGLNLYLGGSTGTGKTSWGVKILKQYIYNNPSYSNPTSVYCSVPALLNRITDAQYDNKKKTLLEKYWDKLKYCDLLLLDDLAFRPMSTYEQARVYELINYRIENKLSNIYTANKWGEDLKEILGGEILYSRIYSSCRDEHKLMLEGHDRRGGRI